MRLPLHLSGACVGAHLWSFAMHCRSPTRNFDSDMHTVQPGDILHGVVTFNPQNESYTIVHTDLTDGWSVSAEIPVQREGGKAKIYNIAYIVFEKPAECNQYPPEVRKEQGFCCLCSLVFAERDGALMCYSAGVGQSSVHAVEYEVWSGGNCICHPCVGVARCVRLLSACVRIN